jgi:hypothetical protein
MIHLAYKMHMAQMADCPPIWLFWEVGVRIRLGYYESRCLVGGTVGCDIAGGRARVLGALIMQLGEVTAVLVVIKALELMDTMPGSSVDDVVHVGFLATIQVLPPLIQTALYSV